MDDYVDYLKKFPRRSAAKGGGAGSIGADPKFTEAPLVNVRETAILPCSRRLKNKITNRRRLSEFGRLMFPKCGRDRRFPHPMAHILRGTNGS